MTQLLNDLQTEISKDPSTKPRLKGNVLDIEHVHAPDSRTILEDNGKGVKVRFEIEMKLPYFPPNLSEKSIQQALDKIYDGVRKVPTNPPVPEYTVVKNNKVSIVLDDAGNDVDTVLDNMDNLSKRTTQILRFLFQRLGTMPSHTCSGCNSCGTH